MRRDFTYKAYQSLLQAYTEKGYQLISYENYLSNPFVYKKAVVLRHDVDKWPLNSVDTATIENKLGAQGSYYFRIVPESFDESSIKKIADLGHEIGYHYEDMTLAKGDYGKAIALFKKHLDEVRKFYPVKTMCMHGSPLSKWDNKLLWTEYNYRDYGIVGEPYFDIDYNQFLYITDTGRSWSNQSSNVRDKVNSKFNFEIKNTSDLINLIEGDKLPDLIVQNIHPQRWNDNYIKWFAEYVGQNIKNVAKQVVVKLRG